MSIRWRASTMSIQEMTNSIYRVGWMWRIYSRRLIVSRVLVIDAILSRTDIDQMKNSMPRIVWAEDVFWNVDIDVIRLRSQSHRVNSTRSSTTSLYNAEFQTFTHVMRCQRCNSTSSQCEFITHVDGFHVIGQWLIGNECPQSIVDLIECELRYRDQLCRTDTQF